MNRLWQKDSPMVTSLMETDVYKILMLYFIWQFFPGLHVSFSFTNRTRSVRLADEIDLGFLRAQLDSVRKLRFEERDIEHLRSWELFPREFLRDLSTLRLPALSVEKNHTTGQLCIDVEGRWFDTTLWELFVLPIVSECRARAVIGESASLHRTVIREGGARLLKKIESIRQLRWPIALFDLRRRLSRTWETHTTSLLLNEVPKHITGISNVASARDFGLEAQGTNAHELPMAVAALRGHEGDEAVRNAPYEVLRKWEQVFGHKALIMLPDAYGSESFFQELPTDILRRWRGSRQDSGDPILYGERMVERYRAYGIDPLEKLVIFSDGLTVEKMQRIESALHGKILGAFGWGTNKVFDVPGVSPLSLVMKLVSAAGRPAVKLSDNLDKAVGDPEEIAAMRRIFGYDESYQEVPVY